MTDHMPHWQPNPKTDYTGPADSRWSVGDGHKYRRERRDAPDPEPRDWVAMDWIAWAIIAGMALWAIWRCYQ